jgi:hypothetical protein
MVLTRISVNENTQVPNTSNTSQNANNPPPAGGRLSLPDDSSNPEGHHPPNSNGGPPGGGGGGGGGGRHGGGGYYPRQPFHNDHSYPPPGGNPYPGGNGGNPGGGGGGGGGGPPYSGNQFGPPAPYGNMPPSMKTELKVEQLPEWDGNHWTAIEYFWQVQQLAYLGGWIPEALGYWLWFRLKEGSTVKKWFVTLPVTHQSYMRSHYLKFLK